MAFIFYAEKDHVAVQNKDKGRDFPYLKFAFYLGTLVLKESQILSVTHVVWH